jgi:hypothetical protein
VRPPPFVHACSSASGVHSTAIANRFGEAAFATSSRRLLMVGLDHDFEPKRVVFATVRLAS